MKISNVVKLLLIATIMIMVAFAAQAQQKPITIDKELSEDFQTKQDVYNFMIGVSYDANKNYIKSGNIENAEVAYEVFYHYMQLRNGETPEPLSKRGEAFMKLVKRMINEREITNLLIVRFIKEGEAIKNIDKTYRI